MLFSNEQDEPEPERKRGPQPRIPSTAAACSERFRETHLAPEATALIRAMSRDKAKEVCLDILRELGFAVEHVRDKAKRDRSKEISARSEKRRLIREAKAAAKLKAHEPAALCSHQVANPSSA